MEGREKQVQTSNHASENKLWLEADQSEKYEQMKSKLLISLEAGLEYFHSNYTYLDLASDGERDFTPDGELVVRTLLARVGLAYDRVLKSWLMASYDSNLRPNESPEEASYHDNSATFNSLNAVAYANLSRILELECRQEGVVKYLYDQQGLVNFARFPIDLLLQQYEQREDLRQYGVYVITAFDPNGVMAHAGKIASAVSAQLPTDKLLRLIEIRGKFDLASKLLRLKYRYNQSDKNKIGFMIFDAHGTEQAIRTGLVGNEASGNKKVESIDSFDVLNDGLVRAGHLLIEDGADVVLLACSTGARQGVAEAAARGLNCRITAPLADILTADIKVELTDQGKIRLNPTYDGAETAIYQPNEQ